MLPLRGVGGGGELRHQHRIFALGGGSVLCVHSSDRQFRGRCRERSDDHAERRWWPREPGCCGESSVSDVFRPVRGYAERCSGGCGEQHGKLQAVHFVDRHRRDQRVGVSDRPKPNDVPDGRANARRFGICFVAVYFSPVSLGAKQAALTISDNASPGTQLVVLTGTAVGPTAVLSVTSLAIGQQNAGSASAPQAITVVKHRERIAHDSLHFAYRHEQRGVLGK